MNGAREGAGGWRGGHAARRALLVVGVWSAVGSAQVAPPAAPALLQLSYPAVPGRTLVVSAGGNLQAALDSAQRGDEVVLAAGATFTGNFVLKPKSGTVANGWVVVRSSQLGQLPAGVRVGPAQAGLMARVQTANNMAALATAAGASGWWVAGVEVGVAPALAVLNNGLVLLGDGSSAQNSLSQVASYLVLDRVYVHASATQETKRCVALNSAASEVRDSYLYDCHANGMDTQAIAGWNGPGPYRIVNNMLAGAGENVIFGGADPAIAGLVPSDIEVRRNYLYTPATWKGVWQKKNLLELKNARRVLVEGNVLDGVWVDGQVGFAVLLKSVNQSGGCVWCRVTDVALRGNLIRNFAGGINLAGLPQGPTDTTTRRIAIVGNVLEGLAYPGNGNLLQLLSNGRDLAIDSLVANGGTAANMLLALDVAPAWTNFAFTNVVATPGAYGIKASGYAVGEASLGVVAGTVDYRNVYLIGAPRGGWPRSRFVADARGVVLDGVIRARVAAATAGVAVR